MELIADYTDGAGHWQQYLIPTDENDTMGADYILHATLNGEDYQGDGYLYPATYGVDALTSAVWDEWTTDTHRVRMEATGDHIEVDGTLYLITWE